MSSRNRGRQLLGGASSSSESSTEELNEDSPDDSQHSSSSDSDVSFVSPNNSPPASPPHSDPSSSGSSDDEPDEEPDPLDWVQQEPDELLALSYHYICTGLSRRLLDESHAQSSLWYGTVHLPTVFNVQDVCRILKRFRTSFDYEKREYCASCLQRIDGSKFCLTNWCPRFRKPCKRSKKTKKVILEKMNVRKLLAVYLRQRIQKIFTSHREVHDGTARDRRDMRFYPEVKQMMETAVMHNGGVLRVVMQAATDGFTFKTLSNSESWPLLLECLSLCPGERTKEENLLLLSIVSSRKKVPGRLWNEILLEIEDAISRPFHITSHGVRYTLHVIIQLCKMDSAAVQSLYGMAGWSGRMGCPRCLTTGQRYQLAVGSKQVWPPDGAALRTDVSCQMDSAVSQNGFLHGTTPWCRFIPPTRVSTEALHVLHEGLLKDLLGDIFGKNRNPRAGVRLSRVGLAIAKEMAEDGFFSTRSIAYVFDPTETGKVSGSEISEVFCTIIPALVGHRQFVYTTVSLLLLAIVTFVRVCSTWKMDVDIGRDMSQMARLIYRVHTLLFGESYCTFKLHLLDHFADDLVSRGNPFENSTSQIESAFHCMKLFATRSNTAGFGAQTLTRFAALPSVMHECRKRRRTGSLVMRQLPLKNEAIVCGRNFRGTQMRFGCVILSNSYLVKQESLPQFRHQFERLRRAGCTRFYKRVIIRSKVFSSMLTGIGNSRLCNTQDSQIICDTELVPLLSFRYKDRKDQFINIRLNSNFGIIRDFVVGLLSSTKVRSKEKGVTNHNARIADTMWAALENMRRATNANRKPRFGQEHLPVSFFTGEEQVLTVEEEEHAAEYHNFEPTAHPVDEGDEDEEQGRGIDVESFEQSGVNRHSLLTELMNMAD